MQTWVLSILVVTTQMLSITTTETRLPAPADIKIVIFDPPGFIIKWKLVPGDVEPVLGYKVKLWKAKALKTYRYKEVNGTSALVEELDLPKLSDFTTQDGKLHEYVIKGADHSQLVIHQISSGVPYIYQVVAFGPRGDGEPSSEIGVQIGK